MNTEELGSYSGDRVVLAGGVMGTVPLLLRMKDDPAALPELSERLGASIRTNNESVIGVITPDRGRDSSSGVTINSILQTDAHSHLELVRYGEGSGFIRFMMSPQAPGAHLVTRLARALYAFLRQPIRWLRALAVRDHAKQSLILLYMRSLEGTLRLRLGRRLFTGGKRAPATELDEGTAAPERSCPKLPISRTDSPRKCEGSP